MIYVTIDDRNGGVRNAGGSCNTCCCEPIRMVPGDINLMTINYAPWSVPINGRGLVCDPSFEIDIESGCDNDTGGNPAPSNNFYRVNTLPDTMAPIDLTVGAAPVGGVFTYSRIPHTGPFNGTLTVMDAAGEWEYVPNSGFAGFDEFYYRTTDGDGRSIVKQVIIQVTAGAPQPKAFAQPVMVDRSKVIVNSLLHTISFPIQLTPLARSCESYRVSIAAQARDCDNTCYRRTDCFDVIPTRC